MSNVISFSAFKARHSQIDPVLADIVDALHACGGAAHRQTVADWIASRRAGKGVRPSASERDEVYKAYENYVETAARRRRAPLLHSPLGSESYRWALTDAAVTLLERKARGGNQRSKA